MSDGNGDVAADLRTPALQSALEGSDWRAREAAGEAIARRFQAAYPEPSHSESADWPGMRRDGLRYGTPAPTLADEGHGVPPSPEHYVISPAIAEDAPVLGQELRSWAHRSRLSVADLSELSSHIARLGVGHEHAPAALEAQGRGRIEQLSATPEGRRNLERARSAWRSLEHYNPSMATELNDLGASADLAFVEVLARSWRG